MQRLRRSTRGSVSVTRKCSEAHSGVLPDNHLYKDLSQSLNDLANIQCKNSGPDTAAAAHLENFAAKNAEMVQATRAVVFSRGQQLQQEIAERGQFFGWQALVLFLLSFALVIIFTRMIIGPVKGIEKMINLLGEGVHWVIRYCLKGRVNYVLLGRELSGSVSAFPLESQRHEFCAIYFP